MYATLALLVATLVAASHARILDLGSCPQVEPMEGFNMNQMLGKWYVVQATDVTRPCETYNFTKHPRGELNKFQITEVEQHDTLWKGGLHHEHRVTGDLVVPDVRYPGEMKLHLTLDVGTTKFIVFMTDYDNYAGIFTCKKLPLVHKWKAAILSRKPTLDMAYVDKVRTRLSSYNIDPFNLNIISQEHCAQEGAQGSIVQLASNVAVGIRDKVSDVAATIGDMASGVVDKIGDVTSDIGDKISSVGERIGGVIEEASDSNEAAPYH